MQTQLNSFDPQEFARSRGYRIEHIIRRGPMRYRSLNAEQPIEQALALAQLIDQPAVVLGTPLHVLVRGALGADRLAHPQ